MRIPEEVVDLVREGKRPNADRGRNYLPGGRGRGGKRGRGGANA